MGTRKTYLGDGVYACIQDGMLLLTTEDGIGIQNSIYLESEVYEALLAYVKRIQEAVKNGEDV